MKTPRTPAQRLIVAADFEGSPDTVHSQVLSLADKLKGTGAVIKLNSALRLCGYELIKVLNDLGLGVFADLKFFDIPKTLEIDGGLLSQYAPELVTVACAIGEQSISALVKAMPKIEVLGVTVLTSMNNTDILDIHGGLSLSATVGNLAEIAVKAGVKGLICSGHEAKMLRDTHGGKITLNCPGIRSAGTEVKNEDQKRIMTVSQAFTAGATRIVMGREITLSSNPSETVKRIIAEIEEALAS